MLYKVGTRKSKLALAQTDFVINKLKEMYPDDTFEKVFISTTGDKIPDRPLDALGTKGVFVDEIEHALLDKSIDFAVHSMKDMPDEAADGLVFARAWKREDPRDVLILRNAASLDELENGAVIATGSRRRAFQLLKMRPDLRIVPVRGNVDTRLRKLFEPAGGEPVFDGIVLAAAGLKRLGLEKHISQYMSVDEMIPAPAQGTIAIELNAGSAELLSKINDLSDDEMVEITTLERGFLKAVGGDCRLPIAAFADKSGDTFCLRAMFGNTDGSRLAFAQIEGMITGGTAGIAAFGKTGDCDENGIICRTDFDTLSAEMISAAVSIIRKQIR